MAGAPATTAEEIDAALAAAADAGNDAIVVGPYNTSPHATSSARRLNAAREMVKRFLESLTDHLSVRDVLDELE